MYTSIFKIRFTAIPLTLLLLFSVASCVKENDPPEVVPEDTTYKFVKPSNFPVPTYDFANNPVTKEGFLLGRKIFYDRQLSSDGTISCSSCHTSFSSFANSGHAVSHGVQNRLGTRNSPALMNLAWQSQFFWDGGVLDLDHVPINAFTAPFEMNETMGNILYKINKNSDYRTRFKAAFGVDSASTPQLLKAIAQFTVMMVSANSKYDKYKRGEAGGTLTANELAGLQLFQDKCATCHKGDFFSDFSFRNNGMTVNTADKGRGKITLNAADDYKFKMPSLRNLSFTAPYMHDGSITTLEAVVAQYAAGVRNNAASLDPALIRPQGAGFGIPLTVTEQANIVAFLKTLDDDAFVREAKFQ